MWTKSIKATGFPTKISKRERGGPQVRGREPVLGPVKIVLVQLDTACEEAVKLPVARKTVISLRYTVKSRCFVIKIYPVTELDWGIF